MKKRLFKNVLFAFGALALITSCTSDNDYEVQAFSPMIFSDDFNVVAGDGNSLAAKGYTTFNEAGITTWQHDAYNEDGYAVLDNYQSPDAVTIAWLITPSIALGEKSSKKLLFQIAQAYVSSPANSIEVLISDNFDGTNVLNATWTPVAFNQPTLDYDHNFDYTNSMVDLSTYAGNINVAFRVKGSGTNTTIDGTYQVDNIRVINK